MAAPGYQYWSTIPVRKYLYNQKPIKFLLEDGDYRELPLQRQRHSHQEGGKRGHDRILSERVDDSHPDYRERPPRLPLRRCGEFAGTQVEWDCVLLRQESPGRYHRHSGQQWYKSGRISVQRLGAGGWPGWFYVDDPRRTQSFSVQRVLLRQ